MTTPAAPVAEPKPTETPASPDPATEPRRKAYERPSVILKPNGTLDLDPKPTPMTPRTFRRLAIKTLKTERKNHLELGRHVRFSVGGILKSLWPRLDRPIFIVGAPRSGTTFLGDCIARLPEISYHFEPPATKAAGRFVAEGRWSFRRSRWFFRNVYAWLQRVELEGGLRFAEKTPTNALLIPFLDRAFKNAQFIHILRDGRDSAASHVDQPWLRADSVGTGRREPGGYLYGPYAHWWVEPERRAEFEHTSDAHRVIWAWRRYTEAAIRDGRALGPDRYLEIRYETLVTRPRETGEIILDFLGITAPTSREAFLKALDRADPRSVGAWKTRFSDEEKAQIEADSGELLRSLGY